MQQRLQQQVEQINTEAELEARYKQIEQDAMQTINSNKDNVEWYINDHGAEHSKRVKRVIQDLLNLLDRASFARSNLGHFANPDERFKAKVSALLHDIGRLLGADQDHPYESAKYILTNKNLKLTDEQRKAIARLAILHADGTTRQMYGTDDLGELARKGIISREEAYLATVLRIADALDIGKKRVQQNTAGDSFEKVVNRINRDLPQDDAKVRLSHWYGHQGINNTTVTLRNKITLNISLDSNRLEPHGEDVAYRVRDLIRDVSSSLLGKNYSIRFTAKDTSKAQEWYDKHGDIFIDEIQGMDVRLGGE
jgi:metal-dependent HD superfamily phosphatase/phosphodiesterase